MPQTPQELVHEVVDEVRSLEHEAEEGASARTPAILLGEITVIVSAVVATLLLVALLTYYLTK